MAAEGDKKAPKKDDIKRQSQEQSIVDGFNQLRQEQRSLTAKLVELEMDLNEHNLVAEALQNVDGDRRCYRMVGGVLVERTVKDILPAVMQNKNNYCDVTLTGHHQNSVATMLAPGITLALHALGIGSKLIAKSVEALNDKIVKKGQEVNEYREKHNIQIRVSSNPAAKPQTSEKSAGQPATGVLV